MTFEGILCTGDHHPDDNCTGQRNYAAGLVLFSAIIILMALGTINTKEAIEGFSTKGCLRWVFCS
jgi:hypothetical protein